MFHFFFSFLGLQKEMTGGGAVYYLACLRFKRIYSRQMKKRRLLYREFPPHPALRPFLKCYWTIKANGRILPASSHGVIPGGHTDIVLNLGEQIVHDESGKIFIDKGGISLVGPFDCFRRFRGAGRFEFFGVRFLCGKVPFSFNFPLRQVRNRAIPLHNIPMNQDLANKIEVLRISSLEPLLLSMCAGWPEPDPVVSSALLRIQQSQGQIPIEILARELRVTVRQVERKFARHVGLSPKAFCRVIRFRYAKLLLSHSRNSPGVGLAYTCGYSDQTHLIREFRLFTGYTPSRYDRSYPVGFFLYNA